MSEKFVAQVIGMKAQGGKELKKYLYGERLTLRQMILAKCYECCGNYADGKEDCLVPECPLYPLMPYGALWRGRPKGKIPVGFVQLMRQKQKGVFMGVGCGEISQEAGRRPN